MKVIDIFTAKPIEIDPLQPEVKKTFKWYCHRCGQHHKSYTKPRIFDVTDNGIRIGECLSPHPKKEEVGREII